MSSFYSRILGVGSYVPEQVWTNQDLSKLMDTSDEWIQQRTGIKQRHWVKQDSSLGLRSIARSISSNRPRTFFFVTQSTNLTLQGLFIQVGLSF